MRVPAAAKDAALKAVGLAKHFDTEYLFREVSFTLTAGDRIGLVGPNGAGKSTLLALLTGAEKPTHGHVEVGPGTTLGFAEPGPPAGTVGGYLRGGLGEVADLTDRMRQLEHRLEQGDLAVLDEYGRVQDRWTALDGWTLANRIAEVRDRLDLAQLDDGVAVAETSGGEQARLMLARVLLTGPDLLLLDEPTNHLDAAGIDWLGRWLASFPGGLLVVSHDRAFLDRTVHRIIELDGIHEEPQFYDGGYTAYREEKARRWERLLLDFEAQEKQRIRWEADIERTKAQARGVEDTVRSGLGADQLRRYAKKVAKKAKARERRLRRQLESARWLARPGTRPPLVLAFPAGSAGLAGTAGTASDRVAVRAAAVEVKRGGKVLLDNVSFVVREGERVLVTGPNGAGKSTLLRVLSGDLEPDSGTVRAPLGVSLLPQVQDHLRSGATVLEFFRSRVPVYVDEAEELLRAHLFGPDDQDDPLWTLSAGELRRLLLAVQVNSPARVLLLDEPTNYLDFEALDVVEEALRAYRGTLIVVSHDPYFADRVGFIRRLHVSAGTVEFCD